MNALTKPDPTYSTVFTVEQIDQDPDAGPVDRIIPSPLNMVSQKRHWESKEHSLSSY
jgi:hypothetical protein